MLIIGPKRTECNAAQNGLMWKDAGLNPKEQGTALAPPSLNPLGGTGKYLPSRSPSSKGVQTQPSRKVKLQLAAQPVGWNFTDGIFYTF
jgi:hypothetical protein